MLSFGNGVLLLYKLPQRVWGRYETGALRCHHSLPEGTCKTKPTSKRCWEMQYGCAGPPSTKLGLLWGRVDFAGKLTSTTLYLPIFLWNCLYFAVSYV